MTNTKKTVVLVLFALVATILATQLVVTGEAKLVNTGEDSIAIKGYDPVAYFTNGRPVKGKSEFTYSWNGARWQFADGAHRDMFAANPERYAPQFGGFCSMALAHGQIADVNPEAWTIVDGKLYLNFSESVRRKFRQNIHDNIKKAEANWKNTQR